MATFSLESSVNTLPDTPILPNYAGHPVVLAKIIDFSIFKDLDPREVFNTLKTYFNSRDMIVIACSDTPQPVPLQQMTLEALEFAMLFSVRSESQTLLGDGNVNAFNDYKTAILANDPGSEAAMEDILKFSFDCILEAISTRTVKKGALYLCPFSQRPVMLLGSRSLYFSDKGRIKAAELRAKKAAMSMRDIFPISPLRMLVAMEVMGTLHILQNGSINHNIQHLQLLLYKGKTYSCKNNNQFNTFLNYLYLLMPCLNLWDQLLILKLQIFV